MSSLARAQNATWNLNPTSDWNTAGNWTPATVPTGIAIFGPSNQTALTFSPGTTGVGALQFNAAAPAYSFALDTTGGVDTVNITAAGIVNNSANAPAFTVTPTTNAFPTLNFRNASSAANASFTAFGIGGPRTELQYSVIFHDSSTAANATFVNQGLASSASYGLAFRDSATAANANITNMIRGNTGFFGDSTAANATINNPDTGGVVFHDGSSAGSAQIFNSSIFGVSTRPGTSAGVAFNDTSTAATATIVNDRGSVIFAGSSTAADATITNTTTAYDGIRGATYFSGSATAGNAVITNNLNGSVFAFGTATLGAATIVNNSSGQTTLSFDSSGGTATITNNSGGRTNFARMAQAPTATIVNNAGGAVDISIDPVLLPQFSAASVGIGSVSGAGNVFLGARNLSVGNLNSNDTISGVIADGGQFGGAGGSLAKVGTGSLTLVGVNTYTGATSISAGILRAGIANALAPTSAFTVAAAGSLDLNNLNQTIGSLAGAGAVTLGSATLTTGGNNSSTTFSGVIGGTGGLVKNGTGAFALTGLNAYGGATAVNAGALIVEGSIAPSSLTTVNAGGTLGGNGIVGATLVNGGTLAPGSAAGSAFGPLTVQGNLVFTAASTYLIQVSPANAGRTNVTGTATLGGATVTAAFAPGSYVDRQYAVVNATGGRIGTFNPTVISNMANFQSTLSYDANNAYLNIALVFKTPGGLNVNQQNVANALTGYFNANGGIPLTFASLTPAGLTQASGELATGSQQATFDAMGLFVGLLTDPFVAGRGDPVAADAAAPQFAAADVLSYAADGKRRTGSERDAYAAMHRKAPGMMDALAQRWSVWAAGYGGSQTTDGNAVLGSNSASSRVGGVTVGADYRFSPNTIAGFALAGGATSFSVANGLGSGRSDLFQAGGFVRHTVGPAYISAALAYGWQDITTDRTVTIAGIDRLRAHFNANAWSGRAEGGYRFVSPWMNFGLTPYAAGQFVTYDLPAYAEQVLVGPGVFALNYAAKQVTASRSELGLRTDKSFAVENGIFTLRARGAWAHNYNTGRSITPTFQALPGASFVVNGAHQAADAALVTASAEMKWRNGWSAAATFEGEFSSVTRSTAGKGVVRYAW